MIYWFTGQPGAGKTTLAELFIKNSSDHCVHIDGDGLRELFQNFDYSKEGREKNIQSVLDLCRFLDHKKFTVVVSVVAPYRDMRESIKQTNDVVEIYVHTDEIRGREKFFVSDYQKPEENYLDLDTTNITPEESLKQVIEYAKNTRRG